MRAISFLRLRSIAIGLISNALAQGLSLPPLDAAAAGVCC